MPDVLPPFEPGEQLCPACSAPTRPRTTPHPAGCLACKTQAAYNQAHVQRMCTDCGHTWPETMADEDIAEAE